MRNNRLFGKKMEDVACSFLLQQGLRLTKRNYQCRFGEIDLVMQDNQTLVFVEVRYRNNSSFGNAAETIDKNKRQRIVFTAQHYMQKHQYSGDVRFDAVCFNADTNPEWIMGAFTNDESARSSFTR